jgi:hypothetical protein
MLLPRGKVLSPVTQSSTAVLHMPAKLLILPIPKGLKAESTHLLREAIPDPSREKQ